MTKKTGCPVCGFDGPCAGCYERDQRMAQAVEEQAAYKAGYAYGVEQGTDKHVEAKADLGLYPENQDLRIEWDRGFAHCKANRLLGHDVKFLYEHEMYWLEDEAVVVFKMQDKINKLEAELKKVRYGKETV